MVSQRRSIPSLDGCVSFEADAVRVGDTRVPGHVERGSVVVVLGDRLHPLTLGERALALSLGADGLARTVWQLSGGTATLARSIEQQAVVEAVALYLAGAANTASLHLALVVAGRTLGDPAGAQALAATVADDLAAGLAPGVPDTRAEAGWTVLRIGPPAAPDEAAGDLRHPVSVRAALVAALLDRAELPVPPELADAPPADPTRLATTAPVLTPASGPAEPAARVPGPHATESPRRDAGLVAAGAPLPASGASAAGTPAAPPADTREPVASLVAPSRFPPTSPAASPQSPSEPGRVTPGAPGAAWAFTTSSGVLPRVARPRSGAGWQPSTAGVVDPRPQVLTGIDWQALPTLGSRPAPGLAADDGAGSQAPLASRPASVVWAARTTGAHEEALVDAVLGLSTEVAEQLLAVADRRGLA